MTTEAVRRASRTRRPPCGRCGVQDHVAKVDGDYWQCGACGWVHGEAYDVDEFPDTMPLDRARLRWHVEQRYGGGGITWRATTERLPIPDDPATVPTGPGKFVAVVTGNPARGFTARVCNGNYRPFDWDEGRRRFDSLARAQKAAESLIYQVGLVVE